MWILVKDLACLHDDASLTQDEIGDWNFCHRQSLLMFFIEAAVHRSPLILPWVVLLKLSVNNNPASRNSAAYIPSTFFALSSLLLVLTVVVLIRVDL